MNDQAAFTRFLSRQYAIAPPLDFVVLGTALVTAGVWGMRASGDWDLFVRCGWIAVATIAVGVVDSVSVLGLGPRPRSPDSDVGPGLGSRARTLVSGYNDGFPLTRESVAVSMQLDLSQLGRHGRADEHLDRTYEAAAFAAPGAQDEEYVVVSPVHLVLDVHKTGDAFRVWGRVEATLQLECGRCLEPFTIPVESAFDLRYVPQETEAADEREIREDDLATSYYRDNTLDLDELMREQFQLALPMKPLCAEDCKGLCPECGTNLNTSTCGCAPRWEDPRLEALKGLLDRNKES